MRKKLVQPLKTCAGCGKGFSPKRRTQKYCNDDCRVVYYKKHYFGVTEVNKVCPNCGAVFSTTMPKKQTYCKPECRKEAAKKRGEGKLAQLDTETLTAYRERFCTLENDGFRCTYCGRGPKEGAVLGVVEELGELRTICEECKAGKNSTGGES